MAHRRLRSGVTLHRFFLPLDAFQGDMVAFSKEPARQIARVLRLRPGDRVIALDGSGLEYTVRLETVGKTVEGQIEQREVNQAEPATSLTLYQGLLKGTKLELVLQKCTEVGVSRFVPVVTTRSVPNEPSASRRSRFASIVREAAEQSRRGRVPELAEPMPIRRAIAEACAAGPAIFLWEEEQTRRLDEALPPALPGEVGLFVGPEGGFTREEAEEARVAGASIVTLGPRFLRAETAAIVGSALVLQRVGDQ
ncbi:MAG TPA: RsmE family RNA methyltransferase [Chloroflexota bacterium]